MLKTVLERHDIVLETTTTCFERCMPFRECTSRGIQTLVKINFKRDNWL